MKRDPKQRAEAIAELDDAADCLLEASKRFVAAGSARDAERSSRLALAVLELKRGNTERPS